MSAEKNKLLKRKTTATTNAREKESGAAGATLGTMRTARTGDGRLVNIPENTGTAHFTCPKCNTINEFDPKDNKTRKCRSPACERARHNRAMMAGVIPIADPKHRGPLADHSAEDSASASAAAGSMRDVENGGAGGGGAAGAAAADSDDIARNEDLVNGQDTDEHVEPSMAKKPRIGVTSAAAAAAAALGDGPKSDEKAAKAASAAAGFQLGTLYKCVTEEFKKVGAIQYDPRTGFVGHWWANLAVHDTNREQRDVSITISKRDESKFSCSVRIRKTSSSVVRLPPMAIGGATMAGLFGNFLPTVDLDEKEKMRKAADNLLARELQSAKCTYQCTFPASGTNPDADALRQWFACIERQGCRSALKCDNSLRGDYEVFVSLFEASLEKEQALRARNGMGPMSATEQEEFTLTAFMKNNWRPLIHEPKNTDKDKREELLERYGNIEAFYVSHYVCTQFERDTPDAAALSNKHVSALYNKLKSPAYVHPDAAFDAKLNEYIKHPVDSTRQKKPLYLNILPCRDSMGQTIPWSKRTRIGPGCSVSFDVTFGYVPKTKSPAHLVLNVVAMRVTGERNSGATKFDPNLAVPAIEGAIEFNGTDGKDSMQDLVNALPMIEDAAPVGLLPAPSPAAEHGKGRSGADIEKID